MQVCQLEQSAHACLRSHDRHVGRLDSILPDEQTAYRAQDGGVGRDTNGARHRGEEQQRQQESSHARSHAYSVTCYKGKKGERGKKGEKGEKGEKGTRGKK